MYRNIKKRIFHIIMIIIIIFVILCTAGILALRYQVEGESNMPFKITKIAIIENVEGIEKQNTTEKWNLDVNQNNDIYIYIEKNSQYKKTELIDTIQINNITINKKNEVGITKIYKAVENEKRMFTNAEENEIKEITFKGELQSNIKEQKISNQGGIMAFRYAINNVSQYISEQEEEIDHSQLLKISNVNADDLKTELSFDIIMTLQSGKKFKTTLNLNIPSDEIIEEGTKGIEITDLKDIIFKRIEN